MPQLNTTPWFITLLMSWTSPLSILPLKILSYNFHSNLTICTTKAYKSTTRGRSWY